MGGNISIYEFLKLLKTGNGDEIIDLVSKFQSGEIDFTDFDFDYD